MSGDGATRAWTSWGGDPGEVDDERIARSARSGRRKRRIGVALAVLVGLAAVSAVVEVARSEPELAVANHLETADYYRDAEPLGTPPAAPEGKGGYEFMGLQGDGTGHPIAYDPCVPVRYVVRPDGAPEGGDALLRAAIAEVSRATGLIFTDHGTSSEVPSAQREIYEIDYLVFRPVLIAWSDEREAPDLTGDTAGYAGSGYLEGNAWSPEAPGTRRYVTGQVVLDREDIDAMLLESHGRKHVRGLILHELGHLVGLDHVHDPSQLMQRYLDDGITEFRDGDLRGLHRLGSGHCFIA